MARVLDERQRIYRRYPILDAKPRDGPREPQAAQDLGPQDCPLAATESCLRRVA
jgi:hypothetical protein